MRCNQCGRIPQNFEICEDKACIHRHIEIKIFKTGRGTYFAEMKHHDNYYGGLDAPDIPALLVQVIAQIKDKNLKI